MAENKNLSPETISAQALRQIDAMTRGITPASHLSSTYVRDESYQLTDARHSYGRDENPGFRNWLRLSIGIESVDDLIADLEQAIE